MNRGEMRTEVRYLLNESTAAFWTDTEIDNWLDQGQRDIAVKALCIESTGSITTAAGTREYSYTGLKCAACEYNNKTLVAIPIKQIGHRTINGVTPQYWYEYNGKIGVDPLPDAVYSIKTYLAVDSTDFANDAAVSTLPVIFQSSILLYAFYKGLMKERKFAQAAQIYNIYINEITYERQDIIDRKGNTAADFKAPVEGRNFVRINS